MNLVISSVVALAGLGLLLLFIMALLSPFEAMGWWAGWSKRDLESTAAEGLPASAPGFSPKIRRLFLCLLLAEMFADQWQAVDQTVHLWNLRVFL